MLRRMVRSNILPSCTSTCTSVVTENVVITVEAIMPSRGPVSAGGSSALITSQRKEGFVDSCHIRCRFGDESGSCRWISSFEIECIIN